MPFEINLKKTKISFVGLDLSQQKYEKYQKEISGQYCPYRLPWNSGFSSCSSSGGKRDIRYSVSPCSGAGASRKSTLPALFTIM